MGQMTADAQAKMAIALAATARDYNGDWHKYLDLKGIAVGQLEGRQIAYAASLGAGTLTASAALAWLLDAFLRVNMCPWSEDLTQASVWGFEAGVTAVQNFGIAPNGTKTSTQLTFGGLTNAGVFSNIVVVNAAHYKGAIWVRSGTAVGLFRLKEAGSSSGAGSVNISPVWQQLVTGDMLTTSTGGGLYLQQTGGQTGSVIEVWGAQMNPGTTLSNYGRTAAAGIGIVI